MIALLRVALLKGGTKRLLCFWRSFLLVMTSCELQVASYGLETVSETHWRIGTGGGWLRGWRAVGPPKANHLPTPMTHHCSKTLIHCPICSLLGILQNEALANDLHLLHWCRCSKTFQLFPWWLFKVFLHVTITLAAPVEPPVITDGPSKTTPNTYS